MNEVQKKNRKRSFFTELIYKHFYLMLLENKCRFQQIILQDFSVLLHLHKPSRAPSTTLLMCNAAVFSMKTKKLNCLINQQNPLICFSLLRAFQQILVQKSCKFKASVCVWEEYRGQIVQSVILCPLSWRVWKERVLTRF